MSAWDDVRVGDLVRVTNGETSGTGRVYRRANNGALFLPLVYGASANIKYMEEEGYALEIIEKAPVPLPTVPGIYTDIQGSIWEVTKDGKLCYLSASPATGYEFDDINACAASFAPFTRLTPEGE